MQELEDTPMRIGRLLPTASGVPGVGRRKFRQRSMPGQSVPMNASAVGIRIGAGSMRGTRAAIDARIAGAAREIGVTADECPLGVNAGHRS